MNAHAKIAIVILAAGRSVRMPDGNKLLMQLGDKPLVRHVAEAALASAADEVLLVTGFEAERVRDALSGLPVPSFVNEMHAEGLGVSLRAGIAQLRLKADGALILLGDMALVPARALDRSIEAFKTADGEPICIPVYEGRRGNPVLLPRRLFAELGRLEGDEGARGIIKRETDGVLEVPVDTPAIHMDADTPADLKLMRAHHDRRKRSAAPESG